MKYIQAGILVLIILALPIKSAQTLFNPDIFSSTCINSKGQNIPSFIAPVGKRLAIAWLTTEGKRGITIDPNLLQTASPALIEFIWLHECGHHVLNHLSFIKKSKEETLTVQTEADCFAIKHSTYIKTPLDLNAVLLEFFGSASSKRYEIAQSCKSF